MSGNLVYYRPHASGLSESEPESELERRAGPGMGKLRWVGIVGCIVGCILLAASIFYLQASDAETKISKPAPRRPSTWLKFYESFRAVDEHGGEGKEGFAVVQGGRHGTGDPKLKELIERFRSAKDAEVREVAERLMYHEDTRETYTQSKKDVFMCLRDTQGAEKEYYSMENLAYVMAHEIAHAWMEKYDPQHLTQEFHDKHERVLNSVRTENFNPSPPRNGYCENVPRPAGAVN